MPAKRTDPRLHTFQRAEGTYVASGHPASHLAAVFAAERERLAAEGKPKRRRRAPATETNIDPAAQLRLVG